MVRHRRAMDYYNTKARPNDWSTSIKDPHRFLTASRLNVYKASGRFAKKSAQGQEKPSLVPVRSPNQVCG
jgi:hypothetical protein